MTQFVTPICTQCKRYKFDSESISCTSFPNGIPKQILESDADHREPFTGDGGKLFLPKNQKAEDYADFVFSVVVDNG